MDRIMEACSCMHGVYTLYKKPYSDVVNQEVVKKLVVEVTSLDSTIPTLQIRGEEVLNYQAHYTCTTMLLFIASFRCCKAFFSE